MTVKTVLTSSVAALALMGAASLPASAESMEERSLTIAAAALPAFDQVVADEDAPLAFSMPVYFQPGDAQVTPEAREALAAFADEAMQAGITQISISAGKDTAATDAREEAVRKTLIELGVPEHTLMPDPSQGGPNLPTASLGGLEWDA